MKKIIFSFAFSVLLFSFSENTNIKIADAYSLTSFSEIRDIEISYEEKQADIVNFNEFLRIHYYNYLGKKSEKEKNTSMVKLNSDISKLKYSTEYDDRKPPIVLHWTAGNNAMGAIKTLFVERKGMKEGIISVDYVVSEPLFHPDYPDRPARSYSIKLSKSQVATTWFHVPNNAMPEIKAQDRKYNKAISIEIVGWRYAKNPKGKKNDDTELGKNGIRESFEGDFEDFNDFEKKYSKYSTVLKLINNLAEKHNFTNAIDEFTPETEIDPNLQQKGITYLNGPLSQYIKGHGLVALEHTLMFNSTYIKEKVDFTPKELLVFYSDLKDFRSYMKDQEIVKSIEERVLISEKLPQTEYQKVSDLILNLRSKRQKEYLTMALDLNLLKITSLEKLNAERKEIDAFSKKEKDKLTSFLIAKFLEEANKIHEEEYDYLKNVILTFQDNKIREKISQQLYDRYAYNNKKKDS
ncbi:MAG: hypothetical protein AABZ74_18940 [Cyanobacteriota bacterium]